MIWCSDQTNPQMHLFQTDIIFWLAESLYCLSTYVVVLEWRPCLSEIYLHPPMLCYSVLGFLQDLWQRQTLNWLIRFNQRKNNCEKHVVELTEKKNKYGWNLWSSAVQSFQPILFPFSASKLLYSVHQCLSLQIKHFNDSYTFPFSFCFSSQNERFHSRSWLVSPLAAASSFCFSFSVRFTSSSAFWSSVRSQCK